MSEANQQQQQQVPPQSAVPPGVDPAEYAKQMQERADGKQPQEPAKLFAGKYKSVEELEKGYAELMKLHGGKQPAQEPSETRTQTSDSSQQQQQTADGQQQAAQQAVAQAGLDFNALSAEFAANGELSADSYKALHEKSGIPREIVDQFINGQVAAQQIAREEVHKIVGGGDNYQQLVTWAKDNLSPVEIAAFNKIAGGADLTATKIAVQGLKSRYDAAFGSEPNLISDNLASNGAVGYRSKAEMTKDMADPRYASDPAFRQDVMNKLRVTTAF